MPNHFQGNMTITSTKRATKADVFKMYQYLKDHEMENGEQTGDFFKEFIPLPLKEGQDWSYELADEYWGSKWGIYDWNVGNLTKGDEENLTHSSQGKASFSVNFNSAWNMPKAGIDQLRKKYNIKIEASGYEEGCGFMEYSKEYEMWYVDDIDFKENMKWIFKNTYEGDRNKLIDDIEDDFAGKAVAMLIDNNFDMDALEETEEDIGDCFEILSDIYQNNDSDAICEILDKLLKGRIGARKRLQGLLTQSQDKFYRAGVKWNGEIERQKENFKKLKADYEGKFEKLKEYGATVGADDEIPVEIADAVFARMDAYKAEVAEAKEVIEKQAADFRMIMDGNIRISDENRDLKEELKVLGADYSDLVEERDALKDEVDDCDHQYLEKVEENEELEERAVKAEKNWVMGC